MLTYIISDVHIGSPYLKPALFRRFLDELPEGADLVLNGDTLDYYRRMQLTLPQQEALEWIRQESLRRRVIWVSGNHDTEFRFRGESRVEYVPWLEIGKRLYVAHGHDFDDVMPHHKAFIYFFRAVHRVRIWLGAEGVHVAHYAKRWKTLYGVLIRAVQQKAIRHAKARGCAAVACGHTHCVEDRVIAGIRYINTGAWTEPPVCFVVVDDTHIELKTYRASPSPVARCASG